MLFLRASSSGCKPHKQYAAKCGVGRRARSIVAAKTNESSLRDGSSRAPSLNAARTVKLPHTHALSLPAFANTTIAATPPRR